MCLTSDLPASSRPQDNPPASEAADPSAGPRGCGCVVCELVNNPDACCPLCGNDTVFHQLGNRIHCGNCFLYSEAVADLDGHRTHVPRS